MNKKQVVKYLFYIISIVILIVIGNLYGWVWGLVAFGFCVSAFTLYMSWSSIMIVMRMLETMIWGRPLDRELWKKGEFKHAKARVKFVWRTKEEIAKRKREKAKRDKIERDNIKEHIGR